MIENDLLAHSIVNRFWLYAAVSALIPYWLKALSSVLPLAIQYTDIRSGRLLANKQNCYDAIGVCHWLEGGGVTYIYQTGCDDIGYWGG